MRYQEEGAFMETLAVAVQVGLAQPEAGAPAGTARKRQARFKGGEGTC